MQFCLQTLLLAATMDAKSTRLLKALNGGEHKNDLEDFLLDFINSDGGSDLELSESDGSDCEDEDHGVVFDQISNSLCSHSEDDDDDDDESGGKAAPGGVHVGIASLLELPEVNNIAVETDRKAELEKIMSFDCKCERRCKENAERPHVSCSQQIQPEVIWETRIGMAGLTREQQDMVIMGTIKTCMNDSEMTQSSKKINKKRTFTRSTWTINTVVVCRAAFCFIYG